MGFPSESIEGIYRNKLTTVYEFLETRHKNQYKIYNLCAERTYDHSKFHNRVSHYPFKDHNAPPLELFTEFCEDVQDWLQRRESHVVVVHCKAGKGRTGVMICAYLVYSGFVDSAEEALELYSEMRTKNRKGVTIPSQIRYVKYFERIFKESLSINPSMLFLKSIKLHTIPRTNQELSIEMYIKETKIFESTLESISVINSDSGMLINLKKALPLCGDIKVVLFNGLCHFWFNTLFIEDNSATFSKNEIDKAIKDKRHKIFDSQFSVRLDFTEHE